MAEVNESEQTLTEVAEGVWVRQSEWVWTNSIVVRGDEGLIVIDPGIHGSEMNALADDIDRLGIPVVAGFSTHPHTDHLLWHSRFGDVPRYATSAGAEFAAETREQQLEGPEEDGWVDVPLDLIALVTPLPADGRPVPGEIIEHRAHAVGHAAILLSDRGVLIAGDMLSDVLIPLFDSLQTNQLGCLRDGPRPARSGDRSRRRRNPRPRLRRRGAGGRRPPRRRSRLHRGAAARREAGRPASRRRLDVRPPSVERGAGRRSVMADRGPLLIFSMSVSVDGFIADRDGGFELGGPRATSCSASTSRGCGELGACICGRRLYETMLPWETDPAMREDELRTEFADAWSAIPKVVFSRTLDGVEGNARLAEGSLADEVAATLAATDRDVEIGGAGVASEAFELGLVDELRIFRCPIVVGGGTPYLPPVADAVPLELIETRVFGSRVVYECYRRARDVPA